MYFAVRRFLLIAAASLVLFGPAVRAQSTRSWTGLAAPNNNWTTVGNWNTGVPVSGDTALFNGSGNSNTSISLGAATQPINTIRFDGAIATPYTLGVLSSGDKFNFDAGGSIVLANNINVLQTINAALQSNGALTVTNNGSVGVSLAGDIGIGNSGRFTVINNTAGTTTTLGGIISNVAAQAGSMAFALNGNTVIVNGTNTYTGPTSIQVNTSGANIRIGSSSPFGAGPVTVTLAVGPSAPVLTALASPRSIPNAMNLNSGIVFGAGSNLSFNGQLTIINAAAGGSRTLTNAAGFSTATFGASPGSSTITLGNPVANGGDGVGKTLIFTPVSSTFIINDVLQDPAPGGGAASGKVQYLGTGVNSVRLNSQSTYTGDTTFGGNGTSVQIGASSNATPGPTFTSGPFGTGTLVMNSSTPPILQPFGADRAISNPINMTFGFFVSNPTPADDPTGVHNLELNGPITLGGTGRIITNNLSAGGTLTLGAQAAPSTISLGSTLTFRTQNLTSTTTIVNDSITGAGAITVQDRAFVQLNGAASYSGVTLLAGTGSELRVNGVKSGSGAVSIGAGTILSGSGSVSGAISNSGTIDPSADTPLRTLTATNNVTMAAGSHLKIDLSGSLADKLAVGGALDLSANDFLDVAGGAGTGSWVVASYGSLTGTFNTVTAGYSVNYGTGTNSQITLTKLPTLINGDFNNDGKVDAGDYVTWRKNDGTSNGLPNDNGLGTPVGASHYTLWRANFGKPPGSGLETLDGSAAVPEPATLLLAFLAIAGAKSASARRRVRR